MTLLRLPLRFIPGRRGGTVRRAVAVDFDQSRMWLAPVDLSGSGAKLRKAFTSDAPAGLSLGDPEAVGKWLHDALAEHRLAGLPLVMAAPRGRVIVRSLPLPPDVPDREVAGIVRFQVEKDLPFAPGEAVVDFAIDDQPAVVADAAAGVAPGGTPGVTPGGNPGVVGVEALVAVIRTDVITHYRRIAAAAQTSLHRLTFRSLAHARAAGATLPHDTTGPVAIIHLTMDEVGVDVVDGHRLLFSRGVQMPAGPDDRMPMPAMVEQLVRHLQSYLADEHSRPLSGIYVSGDTGQEDALMRGLGVGTRLTAGGVKKLNPEAAVRLRTDARGFCTVIGLALDAGMPRSHTVDFLHPKEPPVQKDHRRVRILGSVAVVMLLLIVTVGGTYMHLSGKRKQLAALTERYNTMRKENRDVVALARRVRAINAWVNADRTWLDHWAYLSALLPGPREGYITGLTTRPDGAVAFTLRATRPDIFTELARSLHDAGYDYRPGPINTVNDRRGFVFAADVRLQTPREVKLELTALRAPGRPEDDASLDPPASQGENRDRNRQLRQGRPRP